MGILVKGPWRRPKPPLANPASSLANTLLDILVIGYILSLIILPVLFSIYAI